MPDAAPLSERAPEPSAPPARRRVRPVLLTLTVLLVLVVVAGAWLASRAAQAAQGLTEAGEVLDDLRGDLDGDTAAELARRLPELQHDTARARAAAQDPVWRVAEHLPWAGPHLAAVRTVAVAVDDVAREALPAVVDLATLLDAPQIRREDGSFDVALVADASPALDRAATVTDAAARSTAAIDTTGLVARVADPVTQVADGLTSAAGALTTASDAARLLPPMLGGDGPRTYLLLSLNSAELRSAGGIVGAVAAFTADDGAVRLVDQRSTLELRPTDEPVLPLTPDELAVHTDRLGRWVQNTVLTPDFPRSAELASAMWQRETGQVVDGVLAMDPVAVAYVLEATGPVEAGGVELRAETVLDVLLRESYLRLPDPQDADGFYADVASSIFDAVGGGAGDTKALVDSLGRAAGERRLRVWSAHPEEQEVLAGTALGAAFLSAPAGGDGGDGGLAASAGVFLNDGSAGKLDYFLTTELVVDELRCADPGDGWATAVVHLDLRHEPPPDVADYPEYVSGTADTGLPAGGVLTNITVYAPAGGEILDQRVDGALVGGASATEQGRAVSVLTSRLLPGERVRYTFTMTVPAPADDAEATVWTTPTLTSPGSVTSACTD